MPDHSVNTALINEYYSDLSYSNNKYELNNNYYYTKKKPLIVGAFISVL